MARQLGSNRNRTLVRCLRVLALLGTGKRTLNALAQEVGVSTRTIRRDLQAIEEAHLPLRRLYVDGDPAARWTMGQWR